MAESKRGRCLCGAVRFEYDGRENWCAHCHCESCRRATSAPIATFIGLPQERLRWIGREPAVFESSEGVWRMFCGRCGSPMGYTARRWPGEVHLYVASLENPESVTPEAHVCFAEHLSWLTIEDDLPRYPGSGVAGT